MTRPTYSEVMAQVEAEDMALNRSRSGELTTRISLALALFITVYFAAQFLRGVL